MLGHSEKKEPSQLAHVLVLRQEQATAYIHSGGTTGVPIDAHRGGMTPA